MRRFIAMALLCLTVLPGVCSAQEDRTTLIASSKDLRMIKLVPMENGLSSFTLVWPLTDYSFENITAAHAGLRSVISGGTNTRTPWEIETYLELKGIRHQTDTYRDNLLLTITAPHDVFVETLEHLSNLLYGAKYSDEWYARELRLLQPPLATKRRRASDVLLRVTEYLTRKSADADAPILGPRFRFGRPSHAILRTENDAADQRARRLLSNLPTGEPTSFLSHLAGWLQAGETQSFGIPSGVIHFADRDSSETLILVVEAVEFDNEDDQVGAHLLMDYIGSGQGSEMFRIIRQEMRASYDPGADFHFFGARRAILSMSATVDATQWPEIYDEMREIYQKVRQANVDPEGLEIQYGWLDGHYYFNFYRDSNWTAKHFVDAYPGRVPDQLGHQLFASVENLDLESVVSRADTLLPPFDDYLIVIIGGGVSPSLALPDVAYCSLNASEQIGQCMHTLSNAEN